MSQRTSTAITFLAAAAVAAVPITYLWNANAKLREELDAATHRVDETRSELKIQRTLHTAAEQELGVLESANATVAAGGEIPEEVAAKLAATSGVDAGPATKDASPAEGLAAMFDNPAMQEMMGQQLMASVETNYGELFDDQGLDDATRKAVYKLVVDNQLGAIGEIKAFFTGASEDEKAAAKARVMEITAETSGKIEELLGAERYDEFQRYQKSTSERMELSSLKPQLEDAENPLSFEQEEQLMAIMFDERSKGAIADVFGDPTAMFQEGSDLSIEGIDKLVGQYEEIHGRILGRAADVLDDGQLEAFSANQGSFRDMIDMSFKMNLKMLGLAGEE